MYNGKSRRERAERVNNSSDRRPISDSVSRATPTTRAAVTTPARTARSNLGSAGERLAVAELARHGYHICELNYRSLFGEIDIVAKDADALVFVEVKTRRGTAFGLPEEAVTAHKRRKLLEVALGYLEAHNIGDVAWRIDVVAVQLSPAGHVQEVRIFRSAINDMHP